MSDNIFNTSYDNSNEISGDTVDSSTHNEYEENMLNVIEETMINNAEEGYVYSPIPNNFGISNENSPNLTELPSLSTLYIPSINMNTQNSINIGGIGNNGLTNLVLHPPILNSSLSSNLLTQPPSSNNNLTNSNLDDVDSFDDIPELVEDTSSIEFTTSFINPFNTSFIPNLSISTQTNNNLPPIIDNNSDENNPFASCLIKPLEYDINEEFIKDKHIILLYSWIFEINYDFYTLKNINIYTDNKNISCISNINKIKDLRTNSNQRTETGEVLKLNNNLKIKKNDFVWVYLIIYYDNIKCNIEFYGIFKEEPDEEILKKNIIEEKIYGSICNIVNINKTAINNNGFNLLPYKVKIT